jgi:hypothetical protein
MTRINKCIELIEQGQAIFSISSPELTYESGKEMSQTWADMIQFDFEHSPFDTVGLSNAERTRHANRYNHAAVKLHDA